MDTVNVIGFPYKLSYFKEQILTEIMSNTENLAARLRNCANGKQIVIYGLGIIGEILVKELKEKGVIPAYILDRNKVCCEYENVHVYNMEETGLLSKDVYIIVTPLLNTDQIGSDLERLEYHANRIHIKELLDNKM